MITQTADLQELYGWAEPRKFSSSFPLVTDKDKSPVESLSPADSSSTTYTTTPTACEECDVAVKDHMLRLYDPLIEFCEECDAAEKDHRTMKPVASPVCDKNQFVQPDCDECVASSPAANGVDNVGPAMFLDAIQPRFSDSRGADMYHVGKRKNSASPFSSRPSKMLHHDDVLGHEVFGGCEGYNVNSSAGSEHPHLYCHWNGHDGKGDIFHTQLELESHLKGHLATAQDDVACQWDSCDASLQAVDELLNHIKVQHFDSYSHPHSECDSGLGESVRSQSSLLAQEAADSGAYAPYRCYWDSCLFSAPDAVSLGDHMVNFHVNPQATGVMSPPQRSSSQQPFQCEFDACDFKSLDFGSFASHIKTDHVGSANADLKHPPHNTALSAAPLTPVSPDELLQCRWISSDGTRCGCKFESTQVLSDHIIEHHVGYRQNEYFCGWEGCDRQHRPFQQRQKIVRHLQVHTNNRPHRCTVCGSTFGEESVLKQHMRVHSGEKPFQCKICKKRFAASAALSVHLRVHTGEKPLKCKYPGCDKRFSESSNLNKHLKTHFHGQGGPCPLCDGHFTDAEELFKHFRSHQN